MTGFTCQRQSGFVLVSTIWILAAMVLFVSFIAVATERIQQDVAEQRSAVLQSMSSRTTESTLVYLMTTQPLSYAGLTVTEPELKVVTDEFNPFSTDFHAVRGNEIRLDGRTYQGLGTTRFSLQDTGSLVSLRVEMDGPAQKLVQLLQRFGVDEDLSENLVTRLRDYIDRDDFPRLSGMEQGGYDRLQMTPPTNRFLASPDQLSGIPQWQAALGDRYDDFLRVVTAGSGNRPNFNSMPREVMLLEFVEEEAAEQLIAHRQEEVFVTLQEVNRAAGTLIPVDPLSFSSVPDTFIRLVLWEESSGQEEWIGIRLTPRQGNTPWKIDYRFTLARAGSKPTYAAGPGQLTYGRQDGAVAATAPQSALFR